MTLPFDFPAWLPWWVPLILLVPVLLWVLAFLLIPFSVIGLKSRLDGVEARLDEIHAEIRTLLLRMPEGGQSVDFDEIYTPPASAAEPRRERIIRRPPIPPAAHELEDRAAEAPNVTRPAAPKDAPRRTEPRLDWPR